MGQFSRHSDASPRGAQRRIYARLRAQIEEGTLAAGTRLLSTRALADELGVSRTTVTAAYEQLAAEGFVITNKGKTARVASVISKSAGRARENPVLPPVLSDYGQRVAAMKPYSMATPHARIDFRYGSVATRDFPALGWQRAYRAELVKRQLSRSYGQPEGSLACALRCRAICAGRGACRARPIRFSWCMARSKGWTCALGCC